MSLQENIMFALRKIHILNISVRLRKLTKFLHIPLVDRFMFIRLYYMFYLYSFIVVNV